MNVQEVRMHARTVMTLDVVKKAWRVLFSVLEALDKVVIVDRNPLMWVSKDDFDFYNTRIGEEPLYDAVTGRYAVRSCLLSFLASVRSGRIGIGSSPCVYASIGPYYRPEPVITPGVREEVFPQLEIEVLDADADQALITALDILGDILRRMGLHEYEVRIEGEPLPGVLARPEVRQADVGRNPGHYISEKRIGFEAFPLGSEDAVAGGGDFTGMLRKCDLRGVHVVGFGLGLMRLA